jgi:hypothetical protein
LIVAAYVDLGSARSASVSPTVTATLDEWTLADAPAALQSPAIGDALIEAVLTGTVPSSGDADVR